MLSKVIKILAVLVIVFGIGFIPNAKKIENELEGYWTVRQAFRNGNETNTLRNAYFDFKKENVVNFDLTGELQEAKYQVLNRLYNQFYGQPKILINENFMGATYTVESISDSTLTIKGVIQDNDFEFVLFKAN